MLARITARQGLGLDRRAVTSLEYGLIAGVLAGVILVGFTAMATSVSGEFGVIVNFLNLSN